MKSAGHGIPHIAVEELAEEIWALREEDRNDLKTLLSGSKLENSKKTFKEMQKKDLARVEGEKVLLTPAGEYIARRVIRRHRLAEFLLAQVLEVTGEEAERTACEFEHLLSDQVTTSVCTYLGHPPLCPHGKPIPKGKCCEQLVADMAPLVVRLTELRPGEDGRIVFIVPKQQARLLKLGSMGLVPGQIVRLDRKSPSVVVQREETTLALDREIGEEIYVKKVMTES
jgi:DtxR family Mn-dependent transcriptional regulator